MNSERGFGVGIIPKSARQTGKTELVDEAIKHQLVKNPPNYKQGVKKLLGGKR